MMPDDDTLCGWGNEAKVAYFLANSDVIVPRRAEQINLLTQLLPYPLDAAISVLDLGAGFGAVTEQILEHYRRATVTCVDGSQAMVAHAAERLRKYGARVKILKADLAEPSWFHILLKPTAPSVESADPALRGASHEWGRDGGAVFDAAVSAIAIHHLTHQRKRELDREVFQLLASGGVFLNNDVVATPPALKARFEVLNLAAIQEQEHAQRGVARTSEQIQTEMREQLRLAGGRHQSHIAPLSDQLAWLTEAGFKSVDCYWRYLDLAIFGGVK
ncbi:MAG: class I SAM-dependent methyltransferase [Deltaproteobacteria bacterium]|nr:class I SAM-dependent methyltransferase [Deltaproteobacteria bacterium]